MTKLTKTLALASVAGGIIDFGGFNVASSALWHGWRGHDGRLFFQKKYMSKKSVAQKKKRILIVDDHPMMRQGLVQLIGAEPDLVACGEHQDR